MFKWASFAVLVVGTAVLALVFRAMMPMPAPASSASNRIQQGTRVVMLGTGNPNADPERSGPAVAVVAGTRSYLIDAGPGVVRRASAAAARRAIPALLAERLQVVFLTHLHSDHTVGLPDLMLSPWTLGRTTPLLVVGPPGTRHMVEKLREAYAEDVRVRLDGLEPANRTGHEVTVREVAPGEVYRDANVRVTALQVPHGSWKSALAYRFDTADRSVVVSGDTGPSREIAAFCGGCDVLVHEVYSIDRFATRPPEWRKYHAAFHTSTRELAGIATAARPKLLILYHQLFWGASDADLEAEIRRGYTGAVSSAKDLGVY